MNCPKGIPSSIYSRSEGLACQGKRRDSFSPLTFLLGWDDLSACCSFFFFSFFLCATEYGWNHLGCMKNPSSLLVQGVWLWKRLLKKDGKRFFLFRHIKALTPRARRCHGDKSPRRAAGWLLFSHLRSSNVYVCMHEWVNEPPATHTYTHTPLSNLPWKAFQGEKLPSPLILTPF